MLAADPARSVAEIERAATTEMARAAQPRGQSAQVIDVAAAVNLALDRILSRAQGIGGLETGFADFDAMTQGLVPGQLVIVAGRPAMGKTAMGLCIATNLAAAEMRRAREAGRAQRRVVFVSLEMSAGELGLRLVASWGRLDAQAAQSGDLPEDLLAVFNDAVREVSALPLRILDTGHLKLSELAATIGRERLAGEVLAVVVDYLQLVKPDHRSESREREVAEIARGLKELAKEVKAPVIALSQLSRKCEERPNPHKRPQLSDLRESGELEQAADIVTGLYRDEVYNRDSEDRGAAEWIVLKQRGGPTGTVRLRWHAAATRFDNFAQQHEPELPPASGDWGGRDDY
jgi:replicative DNA helicase